ncbi:MAG: DUF4177 domain-containing protein [Planctomycetota bacterium]
MNRWEYRTLLFHPQWQVANLDAGELDTLLNRLGDEGWELVSSTSTSLGNGLARELVMIFKRLKVTASREK